MVSVDQFSEDVTKQIDWMGPEVLKVCKVRFDRIYKDFEVNKLCSKQYLDILDVMIGRLFQIVDFPKRKEEDCTCYVSLFSELGNQLRARRNTEDTLVAAIVAGFGAVAWGMSVLFTKDVTLGMALASSLVAGSTYYAATVAIEKIDHGHRVYERVRLSQIFVAKLLNLETGCFPEHLWSPKEPSEGYNRSKRLIWAMCWIAVAACGISILQYVVKWLPH